MKNILKDLKEDVIELWNNQKKILIYFIILYIIFNTMEAIVSIFTENKYVFLLAHITKYVGYFINKISFQKKYLKHFLKTNVLYNDELLIFGKTMAIYLRRLIIPAVASIICIIMFFQIFKVTGNVEYLINNQTLVIWFFVSIELFIFFIMTINIIFVEHIVIIRNKFYKIYDIIKESKNIINSNKLFYSIIYFIVIILPIIIGLMINSYVNIYFALIKTIIEILFILIMICRFKYHVISIFNRINNNTSPNRTVYAAPPIGGLGSEKPQSG